MVIAYWCLLAVVLAPYLLSVASRWGAEYAEYVGDPRAFDRHLKGWRRRAHLAQLNAFEALPGFLAALVVAEFTAAPRGWVDGFAVAFVAFRSLHAWCYITDRPTLRSHAWRFGMLCVVALFVLAAMQ